MFFYLLFFLLMTRMTNALSSTLNVLPRTLAITSWRILKAHAQKRKGRTCSVARLLKCDPQGSVLGTL